MKNKSLIPLYDLVRDSLDKDALGQDYEILVGMCRKEYGLSSYTLHVLIDLVQERKKIQPEWQARPESLEGAFVSKEKAGGYREKTPVRKENAPSSEQKNAFLIPVKTVVCVAFLLISVALLWYAVEQKHIIRTKTDEYCRIYAEKDSLFRQLKEKEDVLLLLADKYAPVVITDLDVGNMDENDRMQTIYGGFLLADSSMFLMPRIRCYALKDTLVVLDVKLYDSNGLEYNMSSSAGYTYSCSVNMKRDYRLVCLWGWGYKMPGKAFDQGVYRFEIWYKKKCLFVKKFVLH